VQDGADDANQIDEIGKFVVRKGARAADDRDGLIVDGTNIDVRVPWTLLQFADPTTLSVIDDDRSTTEQETAISDGIALSVKLGDDLVETSRFRWQGWTEAPVTKERLKRSAQIFSAAVRTLR
jgi:hypothetical protein